MTTLFKSLTVTILFLATTFISFGQKESLLISTVNEIASCDIYAISNSGGYAAAVSKQYQRFEQLVRLATEEQLTDLASNNKNAVVRLYALQALKRKKINISKLIQQQFQNDNTIVVTLDGCFGDKKSVHMLAIQELKAPVSFSN